MRAWRGALGRRSNLLNQAQKQHGCPIVLIFTAAFFLAVVSLLLAVPSPAVAWNPTTYLPSLHFDGNDPIDGIESVFPVRGSGSYSWGSGQLMNTYRDFNLDGNIDVEDDKEMCIPYAISGSAYGWIIEGFHIPSTTPNNQRPAVYVNRVVRSGGWEIYEYWYYYANNPRFDSHEHDWERCYVYVRNGAA